MQTDPFPPEEFDAWAASYDDSVAANSGFPFDGYRQVLDLTVRQAQAASGQHVLDLGTGTGLLAERFAGLGCRLTCTDFSAEMIKQAAARLPQAELLQFDLRAGWPPALNRPFDRIVSAYVFHHFPLAQKVEILARLAGQHLAPGGRIVIADLAFPNQASQDKLAASLGDAWELEYYWLADEALPALREAGLRAEFAQVSSCAGVFTLLPPA